MVVYDFNVNGTDLISGKRFDSNDAMKKWVISILKNSAQEATVIATRTVVDKITPSHFIKYKFVSAITGERGGVTVTYTKF